MSPDATVLPAEASACVTDTDVLAHAGWAAALDELEALALTVDATGGADLDDSAPRLLSWTPPTGLGPLPAELADRAADVAAAQRDALAQVDDARLVVLRHLDVVRTVEASHQPERPVYLDATG
ncbi:hypothetical protein ABID92_001829 [Frigoribacterium sp. PvP120]|uniref:hypothetical protein n=1 Tax=unclassified Frigoribacterium TaxID=2627005 RepID=UPI001AE6546F|nr:hypothetical protein [Frigoribacterium sp. PvP121]MBP1240031.1 hypothetical protein [Frigoribacterium sp. PvP121]